MPKSQRNTRQVSETVELAPGIRIPSDFTGSNQLRSGGTYTVRIVTDPAERQPRVISFTLTFDEPPTVSDLADEQIRKLAGVEIAIASAQIALNQDDGPPFLAKFDAGDPMWAEALRGRGEWHRSHATEVRDLLRGRRGRPERTDESKGEILDYWEDHGIDATKERFGLAERTLRRYIADAKKIKEGR